MKRVCLFAVFAFVPTGLVACATGDQPPVTHGPNFGPDGGEGGPSSDAPSDREGDTAASDAPHDGASDTALDTSPSDSAVDTGTRSDSSPGDTGAPGDSAPDTSGDGSSCPSTLAIVGGNANTVFGATSQGGVSWAVTTLTGSSTSVPAIVALAGGGFTAVFRAGNNGLFATTYASATWSPLSAIGTALTSAAPAVAAVGTGAHLVYLGTDGNFYHGTYTAAGWDAATDKVGVQGDAGFVQSFGPSAPAIAAPGAMPSGFLMAQDGNDGFLYTQGWSGSWSGAVQDGAASVTTVPPAMVALQGGMNDLLVVFNHQADFKLYATARNASTMAWSAPALIDANAFTNDPVALAPISNGRAVMVYRGTNQVPYTSVFDPSMAAPWSTPAPLVASMPTVNPIPSVAPGVCGDDAVAVYAPITGGTEVEVVHFAGGVWSSPTPVTGTSGMTSAAVATEP